MAFLDVFKKLEWDNVGIIIDDEYLNNIKFAGEAKQNRRMIEELNRESLEVGLKINVKKTKVMFENQLVGQKKHDR